MEDDREVRTRLFDSTVRDYVVSLLFFAILYVLSYVILCKLRKTSEIDEYYKDQEEKIVYKVTFWVCTFTLATSVGAALLLPFSIVSREILRLYVDSYYWQWLNASLVHGLWNGIFIFTNVSLFLFIPFAYFFSESIGLSGNSKGLKSRIMETALRLLLFAIIVIGFVAMLFLFFTSRSPAFLLVNTMYYLPFLYSCISFFGVLLLLVSTPLGFARLFTVLGSLIVKPKILRDIDDELEVVRCEEELLTRKMEETAWSNGTLHEMKLKLEEYHSKRLRLEKKIRASPLRRNLGYPVAMLLLFLLTVICALVVLFNTFRLVTGLKEIQTVTKTDILLSISGHLSSLRVIEVTLEIVLFLYLMLTSLVGFYSLPPFKKLFPRYGDTTVTQLIANCALVLILSSALPVLSSILGITNFSLVGEFGHLHWLGHFGLVLVYNVVFATAMVTSLVNKFSTSILYELYSHLRTLCHRRRRGSAMNTRPDVVKFE